LTIADEPLDTDNSVQYSAHRLQYRAHKNAA